METPPNAAGAKDFQVTGISRSGRVRKKSSKLLDFQSPDELDKPIKPKRTPKTGTRGVRGRPPLPDAPWRRKPGENVSAASLDDVATDDELIHDETNLNENARLSESSYGGGTMARMTTDEDDDEDELDELVADIVEGVEAEAENASESKVRQSLYMTEKANKKKMLKDGRIITGKIQRKDKGKTRFTAYSLWAREFRKSSKFGIKQDLDFANTARRLSELWANVPNNEKNMWRRKAKRLAVKNQKQEVTPFANESANNATTAAANANNSFLNRATTSRTKKLAAEKEQQQQQQQQQKLSQENKRNSVLGAGTVIASTSKRGRKPDPNKHAQHPKFGSSMYYNTSATNASSTKSTAHHNNNNNSNFGTHLNMAATTTTQANTASTSSSLTHIKLPMSGIEPIDAAAHLKLLGESLSIIGERLKEHEGQITVSGSLSVLLDSLLCSVGPLLCLTTRIPGLEKRKDLNENLTATLDNIAYVMPGL